MKIIFKNDGQVIYYPDQSETMSETRRMTIRNQCMTIWNDPPNWEDIRSRIRYFAYAEETCPSTGRKHYQGFAQAWKPMRATTWNQLFNTKREGEEGFQATFFSIMRGSFRSNSAYCAKEGQLTEFGEKPEEHGVKSSVTRFKTRLEEGEEPEDIAEEDDNFMTYLMYRKGFQQYKSHIRKKQKLHDREQPNVFVRYGPAGTGKTRWMDDYFGIGNWTYAPDNTGKWFDGCDRDVILFDDVEAGQIPPLSLFKRLTDRYPLQMPVKGGFITWKPKSIVFTSNCHWTTWWNNMSPNDREAVSRRITSEVRVDSI